MKQYSYATKVVLILLVVGVCLQLLLGSISKSWFSFPYNIIEGITFVILTTLVFFIFRKRTFVVRFSSAQMAIVTVITLGVLTIGLGSININPKQVEGTFLDKMGLDDLTKTWYFGVSIGFDELMVFYTETFNGL